MSTYYDFSVKFSGPEHELSAAKKFLLDIRSEHGLEHDSSEPEIEDDGCLWWSGYAKGGLFPIDRSIANFTRGKSSRVWCYQGSTDGCCEGELWFFEKGSFRLEGQWDADIGLSSAVAACELAKSPDEASAIELVGRVALAHSDGWDDDDWAHLRAGGVCSVLLSAALRAHSSLLRSGRLRDALLKSANAFVEVRKYVRKYRAMERKFIVDIDGLLAIIESFQIATELKPSKPTRRESARV